MGDERRHLRYVSAFSGAGGIDLGLHRAGHSALAFIESDAFRREVLAKHWPDVPRFDDVRTFTTDSLQLAGGRRGSGGSELHTATERGKQGRRKDRGVDLFVGGVPCQDWSVAGLRAGLGGARSGLFFEFARIADALLPSGGWLLFENVPGLFSACSCPTCVRRREERRGVLPAHRGADFAVVRGLLASLGFHDLAWRVLDSRHFGVPQRRRRLFLLARRARGRRAAQVLLEPESGGGHFEASGGPKKGASLLAERGTVQALDTKPGGVDGNEAQAGHLIAGTVRSHQRPGSNDTGGVVAGTLTRRYGKGTDSDANDALITPDVAAPLTRGSGKRAPGRRQEDDFNIVARLDGTDTDNEERASKQRTSEGGLDGGERCELGNGPTNDADGVRETARLPGRLDDPVICPFDPTPDGRRYAAMGDAVTVNVAHWLGDRLARFG